MFKDVITCHGSVHFLMKNSRGEVLLEKWAKNMIVNTGVAHIADRLASSQAQAAMSHMAIGSGSTAASASDTVLLAELSRVALSTRTASGATVTYTATFSAGQGTGTLYEAGLFNSASAGTMLSHLIYGIITKGSGDTLAITWTLTFTDDGV